MGLSLSEPTFGKVPYLITKKCDEPKTLEVTSTCRGVQSEGVLCPRFLLGSFFFNDDCRRSTGSTGRRTLAWSRWPDYASAWRRPTFCCTSARRRSRPAPPPTAWAASPVTCSGQLKQKSNQRCLISTEIRFFIFELLIHLTFWAVASCSERVWPAFFVYSATIDGLIHPNQRNLTSTEIRYFFSSF